MTEKELSEFEGPMHAYHVAVGEDSEEVNLSNVLGFLALGAMVLFPFWFEHFLIWYYGL